MPVSSQRLASWLLATVSVLAAGCEGEPSAGPFRDLANQPPLLSSAWERDLTGDEPLRAITAGLIPVDRPLADLGRKLFHDTALSGDASTSCASCHNLANGGDDDRPTSIGISGQVGKVNAPTVLNAALNFRQFWDGRAASLSEQALGPVTNPVEMGADWPKVIERLRDNGSYRQHFATAFGDDRITRSRVVHAIAEFERTLITPSPFDQYLLGDETAIDASAKQGYDLFKAYGCVGCHQGINVGGNLYQKFGALQSAEELISDADLGRNDVTQRAEDVGVFKVPSLRNVARTAPYFHNGSVADLQDAVRIMAATQLGRTIPDRDVTLIVAFLRSLSGSTVAESPRSQTSSNSQGADNARAVGG